MNNIVKLDKKYKNANLDYYTYDGLSTIINMYIDYLILNQKIIGIYIIPTIVYDTIEKEVFKLIRITVLTEKVKFNIHEYLTELFNLYQDEAAEELKYRLDYNAITLANLDINETANMKTIYELASSFIVYDKYNYLNNSQKSARGIEIEDSEIFYDIERKLNINKKEGFYE